MKLVKTALIMLAALPLLAADAGGGRFAGRVFDVEGTRQVADAIVTVTNAKGFVSSVTTDRDGRFSFASLPQGECDFRVTAHGFAIYERELTVSSNAGVKELVIRLLAPANKQTVSVAELMRPAAPRASSESSAHRGY